MEIWKNIIGYENYQVSDHGRVKNIKDKILLGSFDKDGYLRVCLTKLRKEKTIKIHRLVAENFIENYENKPQVNHKDGIKTNNRANNLEWSTAKENINHAWDSKLANPQFGSKNGYSKLNEKDVLLIRESKLTLDKLAKIYCVSFSLIGQIKRREIWNHI